MIRFLLGASPRMMFGLVLVSLLSGTSGAALIAIVHRTLVPSGLDLRLLGTAFAVALLAKALTQYLSQVLLVEYAQQVVLRLCRDLCSRMLAAPLDRLEALGSARLLATLNDDVAVLSAAILIVPTIATSFAVLVGCSAYLVWMSWQAFMLCVAMVTLGTLVYALLLRRSQAALTAARDARDRLFGNFRTLIDGMKELKLHAGRREAFTRLEIDDTTDVLRSHNVAAIRKHLVADIWSQMLFFALVGMLIFGAPALTSMSTATLTGFVFAVLYSMAPVWTLLGSLPTFMRGRISLGRIRALEGDLDMAPPVTGTAAPPAGAGPVHIAIDGATYAYPSQSVDEAGFVLGPIDLHLGPGEVVFVIGGNGCGKSTLVRLLTGLYAPTSGKVRCNGTAVDDAGREAYRQNFSAVFAEFHLFERLFGLDAHARAGEIDRYLQLLGMEHKVSVRDDRLSTTALSSGQRRRLALLTAYLEDRPVYVFDEWAADQDPTYKQVFYTRLLPELKARGKCVVVVTHDDRYFALGDRIIKLEAGRIVPGESANQEMAQGRGRDRRDACGTARPSS